MSKEILQVVEAVSNEKDVNREVIFGALEAALAIATKKKHTEDIGVRVSIDRKTGEYETFQTWEVLDGDEPGIQMEMPDAQLWLIDAVDEDPNIKPGEFIENPIESVKFGRISAQAAKQVIFQKVREAEREKVAAEYQDRVGGLVGGIVKRMDRGNAIIDLGGNAEAIIPKSQQIPRDPIRPGDRLRGCLMEIQSDQRGPQLIVSRVAPELLLELFSLEVPEINDGLIHLKGAARDPGSRAKIAVQSMDRRVDPVGACVGIRGSRVQSVSNELAGERVDIVPWDDNEAQFVINAMSPAEVVSVVVDEEKHSMDIAVEEENLSQAIGRGGQNIRLASELTGWTLNVMGEEEFDSKAEAESLIIQKRLMEQLDVDEDLSAILVQEGFSSVEEVAYVDENEMVAIDEFDADIVSELRSRASDYLLTKAISQEEVLEGGAPNKDLLDLEGMDEQLAYSLAANKIVSMEDLADQAVDEIMELKIADLTSERASALIMKAREPWFAEDI
ncbi:MAG: transcription termination/antitermination protein NusA [Thiotrichales bacterium]|jgi:N utilization substance protein A|nr:transcription termination/antitermination protein NusA [Thiotrichales bacterium]MBT3612753.1 transcription termination/antitermination protein NusA [Thiotrichales bacterium]MBT3751903.1 transcription termination/antitermination protein NusA [Thiotrichales bacterium]MBT3837003.1 transcription termination/antitermination protein NusA [Thiotrichales bacterium]MBT4152581.1 transcription termination/antitermination protein NusA [Thiotrichales bacterium]